MKIETEKIIACLPLEFRGSDAVSGLHYELAQYSCFIGPATKYGECY
jgi:hypothetical protein